METMKTTNGYNASIKHSYMGVEYYVSFSFTSKRTVIRVALTGMAPHIEDKSKAYEDGVNGNFTAESLKAKYPKYFS